MIRSLRVIALAAGAIACASNAQAPPNAAKQTVELRQAVYKLIGSNFKPIGDVLQGRAAFDAAEIRKRAARIAFLAQLAREAFPETAHPGVPATRAKLSIWTQRAEFDQRVTRFAQHAQTLADVSAQETTGSDAFRSAAAAVAQDCKGCHDNFREK